MNAIKSNDSGWFYHGMLKHCTACCAVNYSFKAHVQGGSFNLSPPGLFYEALPWCRGGEAPLAGKCVLTGRHTR